VVISPAFLTRLPSRLLMATRSGESTPKTAESSPSPKHVRIKNRKAAPVLDQDGLRVAAVSAHHRKLVDRRPSSILPGAWRCPSLRDSGPAPSPDAASRPPVSRAGDCGDDALAQRCDVPALVRRVGRAAIRARDLHVRLFPFSPGRPRTASPGWPKTERRLSAAEMIEPRPGPSRSELSWMPSMTRSPLLSCSARGDL